MTAPTTAELSAKYRPVFERIAAGALERERERVLPREQIAWLKEAGFTAVRVPRELGGDGASLPQLFELLVELATVDPHVPQAFRGHIAFVEDRLWAPDSAERTAWLGRFAAGELVGNAVTEIGAAVQGEPGTRLSRAGEHFTIRGEKFYTTGSIFAEWIDTWAADPDGVEVAALVSTASDRVAVSDDWNGFGQRLTGSGTAVFEDAPVRAEHVAPFAERFPYQTALYQLVLVSVSVGVARAALADAVDAVRTRARAFSHGTAAETRHDPQVLESIGRLAAEVAAARALLIEAAGVLQEHADARGGDPALLAELRRRGEVAASEAQLVAVRVSLEAATGLFEGLGASAVSTSLLLDRHWRNARTVASHNPVAFKARIVGDVLVNDVEPPYEWGIGVPRKGAAR